MSYYCFYDILITTKNNTKFFTQTCKYLQNNNIEIDKTVILHCY